MKSRVCDWGADKLLSSNALRGLTVVHIFVASRVNNNILFHGWNRSRGVQLFPQCMCLWINGTVSNGRKTLTEITVYPDTIWWEREWDGEVKRKKGKKEETAQKEFHILQRYILQKVQCFSEPTIRGQARESKPPLSSRSLTNKERVKGKPRHVSDTCR